MYSTAFSFEIMHFYKLCSGRSLTVVFTETFY